MQRCFPCNTEANLILMQEEFTPETSHVGHAAIALLLFPKSVDHFCHFVISREAFADGALTLQLILIFKVTHTVILMHIYTRTEVVSHVDPVNIYCQ